MKKLNLLVCTSEYPPDYSSGIGNVAYNVVEQLKKMGVECTVCSPTGPDIKVGSSKRIQKFGIFGLLYYWHRISKYFKGKEEDFDVVWLHNPLFLRNNPFQRTLITIHTTHYGKRIQRLNPKVYYKISSKIEMYCLNKIDKKARFTVVDTNVRKELGEIGIDRKRITYIPNGVDIGLFKPSDNKKKLRKKFDIPKNDLIILSLGRLTEAKQPLKLIEVFSGIEKKMKDITLIIAGKGGLLNKTKEFVGQKKLKNIRFLGYVDHEKDAPGLYACSDYFIMTSKYEGQPLTLLEAMSSGLPCIVSDIPSLRRIVEHAKCGIVVDFDDEKKVALEIISYLEGGNSAHSKNAREYALNNFDWKIIAGRYLEEFEKVLSKRRGEQ